MDPIQLVNIYLRAYLKVEEEEEIVGLDKVKMTATISLRNPKREMARVDITRYLALSQLSDQWVEVDLAEEVGKLWNEVKHSSEMRISIEIGPEDCRKNRKSSPSIYLFNPADLPPEAEKPVNGSYQPFLLVFTHNHRHHYHAHTTENNENSHTRNKKSLDTTCSRHNQMITFREIGLTDVLSPLSLNIYKCSGSCSEAVLRSRLSLGTNHARIMSSIKYYQKYAADQGQSITSDGPAHTPCCVPTSYEHRALLVLDNEGIFSISAIYRDLVVSACGCV